MTAPQQLAERASERGIGKRLQAAGTSTAYWFYPASKPGAKTIVLVHGYRGTHAGLHAIAGALDDFNLIAPDLPGFGESDDLPVKYTLESYADWLTAFIAAAELKEPIVLAHSFGTLVASAAVARGLKLDRLILLNPVSEPPQGKRSGLQVLGQLSTNFYHWVAERLPNKMAMRLLKNKPLLVLMTRVLSKTPDRELYRWIVDQHRQFFSSFESRRTAIEGYRASLNASVAEFAPEIQTKTLFVIGEWDDITSVEAQHRTAKLFADIELKQIGRVGHLTHYETPGKVAEFVRQFLAAAS